MAWPTGEQVKLAGVDKLSPIYGLVDEVGRTLSALIRTLEDKLGVVK